jgi:hypothetical protein
MNYPFASSIYLNHTQILTFLFNKPRYSTESPSTSYKFSNNYEHQGNFYNKKTVKSSTFNNYQNPNTNQCGRTASERSASSYSSIDSLDQIQNDEVIDLCKSSSISSKTHVNHKPSFMSCNEITANVNISSGSNVRRAVSVKRIELSSEKSNLNRTASIRA